jgi:hypothetical protein
MIGSINGLSFDRPKMIPGTDDTLIPTDNLLLGNPGVSPNTLSF